MFLMFNFDEDIFLKNENLKKYCTFKVGGNAKYVFVCNSTATLLQVCNYCKLHNIMFKVIGLGANLLFDDAGYNGAIIVNRANKIIFKNNSAYVDSGLSVSSLIQKCYQRGLSNLEKLTGIPSTVGGAIVNSLGAFDVNFSDFVEYVVCYKKDDLTKPIKLKNEDCKFAYRTSLFKNDEYIITKAKINLKPENKLIIKQSILEAIKKKTSTQPLNYPSAGSVFKRCEIIPAKVIDELGLKGTQIGDAQISTKHAGFIINLGNATSKDIKELIKFIQEKVKQEFNLELEPEIEYVK